MRNIFRLALRRRVLQQNGLPTPGEAKAVAYSYPDDPKVQHLVAAYLSLARDASALVAEERVWLSRLLWANRGERGPDAWGVGYHEAMEDAASIVKAGQS